LSSAAESPETDNRAALACVSQDVSRLVIAASVLALVIASGQAAADELPFADLPGSGDCYQSSWPGREHLPEPHTTLPSRPTLLVAGPRAALSFDSGNYQVPYRIVESQGDLSRVEVRLDEGLLRLEIQRFGGDTYRACYRVSKKLALEHRTGAIEALV